MCHTNGCATEGKYSTEIGTEKGITQRRKKNQLKNEVTNKKLFERDFTLQKKNPVNSHQWLCVSFNTQYGISSFEHTCLCVYLHFFLHKNVAPSVRKDTVSDTVSFWTKCPRHGWTNTLCDGYGTGSQVEHKG